MREATLWLQDCRLTSRRRREMFAQEYSLSLYNNMGVGEGALAAVQTAVSPLTGRGRAWMLLLTELFRWWAVVSFCLIWWLHLLFYALPQCSKRWWNNVFKVTVLVKMLPRWAARCGQNIDVASGRRASIRHDDFWLPHVRTVTPTVLFHASWSQHTFSNPSRRGSLGSGGPRTAQMVIGSIPGPCTSPVKAGSWNQRRSQWRAFGVGLEQLAKHKVAWCRAAM